MKFPSLREAVSLPIPKAGLSRFSVLKRKNYRARAGFKCGKALVN